jgi:hypothetical protein
MTRLISLIFRCRSLKAGFSWTHEVLFRLAIEKRRRQYYGNRLSRDNGIALRSGPVVLRFVAHDGFEGLSPDGWLSDRISVGVLTRFQAGAGG